MDGWGLANPTVAGPSARRGPWSIQMPLWDISSGLAPDRAALTLIWCRMCLKVAFVSCPPRTQVRLTYWRSCWTCRRTWSWWCSPFWKVLLPFHLSRDSSWNTLWSYLEALTERSLPAYALSILSLKHLKRMYLLEWYYMISNTYPFYFDNSISRLYYGNFVLSIVCSKPGVSNSISPRAILKKHNEFAGQT